MPALMVLQVAGLSERLFAQVTFEWPFTGVQSSVYSQLV